jgi:hypothetical protein
MLLVTCTGAQLAALAWPIADPVTGLAAWAATAGRDRHRLGALAVIGCVRDALDPGSTVFFTLAYPVLLPVGALCRRLLGLRGLSGILAWALCGAVAAPLLAGLRGIGADALWWPVFHSGVARAPAVAAAAVVLGLLVDGVAAPRSRQERYENPLAKG